MRSIGFRVYQQVVTPAECAVLAARLELCRQRARAGARHLMAMPEVAQIAGDERLLAITRAELGPQAIPFRATLFAKTGRANWLVAWHQDIALPLVNCLDTVGWRNRTLKEGVLYAHAPAWALERVVALHLRLDASTPDNGPLRVIPASHTRGVLTTKEIRQIVAANAPVECHVPAGGVLLMRPLLLHASSKAATDAPRRVLHIEYAGGLQLAAGIDLAVV
jgi:ectoine hydroxylase-related dioxygenase (phytanoyl-CoA dioxygenase family)